MNRDEVKGKGEQLKGRLKRGVGRLTDDERLRSEADADEAAGRLREAYGRGRRKVGQAIEDVGERIKR